MCPQKRGKIKPLAVPEAENHSWSMDFMSDKLTCGGRLTTFSVVDDFYREVLSI